MIVECKHCKKAPLTRMITFPVISPNGKRHLACNRLGVVETICAGHAVTDKWRKPE